MSKRKDLIKSRMIPSVYRGFLQGIFHDEDIYTILAYDHSAISNKIELEKIKYPMNMAISTGYLAYKFEYRGYVCYVTRVDNGSLNGYVENLSDNRYCNLDTNYHIDVHGGVTWDNDNLIGFDTSHHMDYTYDLRGLDLSYKRDSTGFIPTYKTVEFVICNLKKLINQVKGN